MFCWSSSAHNQRQSVTFDQEHFLYRESPVNTLNNQKHVDVSTSHTHTQFVNIMVYNHWPETSKPLFTFTSPPKHNMYPWGIKKSVDCISFLIKHLQNWFLFCPSWNLLHFHSCFLTRCPVLPWVPLVHRYFSRHITEACSSWKLCETAGACVESPRHRCTNNGSATWPRKTHSGTDLWLSSFKQKHEIQIIWGSVSRTLAQLCSPCWWAQVLYWHVQTLCLWWCEKPSHLYRLTTMTSASHMGHRGKIIVLMLAACR